MNMPDQIPDRVLVVDDEPVVHELIQEVLPGHAIVSAYHVAGALALLDAGTPFDVAIVDKNLPDGSGLDVIRRIRAARPDAEVLMITGYPSMDSALEAMSLGALDYLAKPMRDINDLRLRVRNACDRVRQRRKERALLAELRESEERYRELFDAGPDAVLVLDAETRDIRDANPAAIRLYGWSQDELVGRCESELVAFDSSPVVRGGILERHDLRRDGSSVPVEITSGIVHRGGHAFVVQVIRDVSERVRAEAERAELEARLSRAGRLEALGRLAAGVAHDINNLLCVIRSLGELATRGLPATAKLDEPREDLLQIEQAVTRAAALTRQLLGFSGRQLVQAKIVDVNELARDAAKLLVRTLGARTQLALDLAAAPTCVKIDPGQLEQVLTNLVVNARDAMPDGGAVTISTRSALDGGVVVCVSDNGMGIPAEILPDIFEPFFTTKQPDRGTGLGLATTREIIHRSGGRIDVRSRVGEGTVFEIWLPGSQESVVAGDGGAPAAVIAGCGEPILIIEDDLAVREVTRRILAGAGYAVQEARTGEDAIAIVQAGTRVEVIVADVELPRMSGVECVTRIVALAPRVQVVFTSGMASDPCSASALTSSSFLSKPYAAEDLLRAVQRAVEHARSAA